MEFIDVIFFQGIFSILLCVLTIPAESVVFLLGANSTLTNPYIMYFRMAYFLIAVFIATLGACFYHEIKPGLNLQIIIPFILFGYGYLAIPLRAVRNLTPGDIDRKKSAFTSFMIGWLMGLLCLVNIVDRYNENTWLKMVAQEMFPPLELITRQTSLALAAIIFASLWFTYVCKVTITTNPLTLVKL